MPYMGQVLSGSSVLGYEELSELCLRSTRTKEEITTLVAYKYVVVGLLAPSRKMELVGIEAS